MKGAKAGSGRPYMARPVPALVFLICYWWFSPPRRGRHSNNRKYRLGERSEPRRCFIQPVAPGLNSFCSGGHNPENSKKIKFGAVRAAFDGPGAAVPRPCWGPAGRAAWPTVRLSCGAEERCGAALRGHARDDISRVRSVIQCFEELIEGTLEADP